MSRRLVAHGRAAAAAAVPGRGVVRAGALTSLHILHFLSPSSLNTGSAFVRRSSFAFRLRSALSCDDEVARAR